MLDYDVVRPRRRGWTPPVPKARSNYWTPVGAGADGGFMPDASGSPLDQPPTVPYAGNAAPSMPLSGNPPEGSVGGGPDEASSLRSAPAISSPAPPPARLNATATQQAFVDSLMPVAREYEKRTGIPAEAYVAVAAHESNFGRAGGNMLFGIKGRGLVTPTWEVYGGKPVNITDEFQTYPNREAAFEGFNSLVSTGRYKSAWDNFQNTRDWKQFFRDINRAGYATDPIWGDKIGNFTDNIIRPMAGGRSYSGYSLGDTSSSTSNPATSSAASASSGRQESARSTGGGSGQTEDYSNVPQARPPRTPKEYFTYANDGREVMKITWDDGVTDFHEMGKTDSPTNGTVLDTGSLPQEPDYTQVPQATTQVPQAVDIAQVPRPAVGTGADDNGDGYDDQTGERLTVWPVPETPGQGFDPSHMTAKPSFIPLPDETAPTTPREADQPAPAAEAPKSPALPEQTYDLNVWPVPTPGQGLDPSHMQPATQPAPDVPLKQDVRDIQGEQPQKPGDMVAPDRRRMGTPRQETVFDFHEPTPIKLPKPDRRPLQFGTDAQGQPTAQAVGPDPNAGVGAIGRASVGLPINPLEAHAELQAEANSMLPQPVRDAPVIGGLIEQALDPAWIPGAGIGDLAAQGVFKAGGAVARAIASPAVRSLAETTLSPVVRASADAALRGLERIQPGLGQAVSVGLPAYISAQHAAALGIGAASGLAANVFTDPEDPNRMPKILAASALGPLGVYGLIQVTPAAVHAFNELARPTGNLPPHVQAMVARLAHALEGARMAGELIDRRILDELADKPRGWNPLDSAVPKRGTGLDQWTSAANLETTKTFGPGITASQQQLADDLVHFGELTRKEGKRLGIITGDVTTRPGVQAYFPHVYEEFAAKARAQTKRGLNPWEFFRDERKHDTLYDAAAAGLTPVNSVSEAWSLYVRRYFSAKGKREFAIDLRKAGGPDVIQRGKPGQGNIPEDWVHASRFKADIPGIAQYSVSPDMALVLKNLTSTSKLRQYQLARAVLNPFAEAKRALFAPSGFHLVHELHQVINAQGVAGIPVFAKAVYHNINPGAFRKFMLTNADAFQEAADAGVTMLRGGHGDPEVGSEWGIAGLGGAAVRAGWAGGSSGALGYTLSKANLDSDEEALHKGLMAAGVGAVAGMAGGPISNGLWNRAVPTMKMMTWQTMRHRIGDLPAADYVNQVYGGQNLEAIARSKTIQDLARVVMLAPDWQEGWARQIGNALRPSWSHPLAQANRWYVFNAAVSSAFMLEGLNLGFNGHFTNENGPGHELGLELTGLYDKMGWPHVDDKGRPFRVYQDILGPYRGLLSAPSDPSNFISARLGLPITTIDELASGKDFAGKDIVAPGEDPIKNAALRVGHLLGRFTPVSGSQLISSFEKDPPAVAGISALTGWRIHRQSPIAEQLQERDKALQELGLTPERQQQALDTYGNLLTLADRKFEETIGRKNLTHQQIDDELRKIDHPSREDINAASLPPTLMADPARTADLRNLMQKYAALGSSASEAPADLAPEHMVDTQAVYDRFWLPRDGMESLTAPQQAQVRQREVAKMANEYGVDPETLLDTIKAKDRGLPGPAPVPGVSSVEIDNWVRRWVSQVNADPFEQSDMRRREINKIAQEWFGTDPTGPDNVWQRIQLRRLPAMRPSEPEQSRNKALDLLFAAHDPVRFPRYMDQNGAPLGNEQMWDQWDAQLAQLDRPGLKRLPENSVLVDGREKADAAKHKYVIGSPAYRDYQRWFGIGRDMTEPQWDKYQAGGYPHYKDTTDVQETLRRDGIADMYKASTPGERITTLVRINVDGREETLPLVAAIRYVRHVARTGWTKALGLDIPGSEDGQETAADAK